ncbi:hypothetical protein N6W67_00040 [Proteus mirabilis]|nr:hypothetical protein [Proteus mirabilis]UXJ02401.1 hypothetical protein N6W67_00040 [Proteus mirabilis]
MRFEAPHNQVQGSDKFDYRYDGFGRMVSRYEKGSSSGQRYHYDSDHRTFCRFRHVTDL